MTNMKHTILSCLLLVSTALTAQTQVNTYTAGVTTDGAVFFLPKTMKPKTGTSSMYIAVMNPALPAVV